MKSNEAVFAKEICLILKNSYRVSRNFRLKWYLDNLLKPVQIISQNLDDIKDDHNDTGIVSISSIPSSDKSDISDILVGTNTRLVFYSTSYNYVFGLDLSSSMLRVDTLQHFVVVEAIITALENCLFSLIQSFIVHGTVNLKPKIHMTLFVQWYGTQDQKHDHCRANKMQQKVLLQCCLLTKETLPIIMQKVKDYVYKCMRLSNSGHHLPTLTKQEDTLLGLLQTGLLAVKVLPSNCKSSIVIITDGVLEEPNAVGLEKIIKQCQNTTISCFFLHVSSSANPLCDFGCLSNIELMQFISNSTNGHYVNMLHVSTADSFCFNFFQQILFPWTFQAPLKMTSDKNLVLRQFSTESCSSFQLRNAFLTDIDMPTLIKRKQNERNIMVDFLTVVGARLREGYYVRSININKSTIEISLELLWWKNDTVVEYKVSSAWPLNSNRSKVEVFICGTYEFLLDVSKRNESKQWTRSRKQTIQRFLIFFQDLLQSDHMLQYLHSFTDESAKYYISDSLRQGQTLYFSPPNSNDYELSMQSQHTSSAFASYWKPILSLDINVWHQWFHIHRIEAVLHHDSFFPNNIFNSGNNVQCRVAFSLIMSMLRSWCSFVLHENHTYVKFIYDDKNSNMPKSFFLVRLTSKHPTMVLKLAFLVGLSGKKRKQVVEDLKQRVAALVYSVPGLSPNTSNSRIRHSSKLHSPSSKSRCAQSSSSEIPCAVLMHKPISQLLVKYPQLPENYMEHVVVHHCTIKSNSSISYEKNFRLTDIQYYLHHHRTVWSLTNTTFTQLTLDTACRLADLLLKIRIRESFHIAYSSSGIINLVKELPMTYSVDTDKVDAYCLVQYVIFPPKVASAESINSLSSVESDDEDLIESPCCHKEITFATEVWVEPQHGQVWQPNQFPNSLSQFDMLNTVSNYTGLNSSEIIDHVNKMDLNCISNIVTLEHLLLMCNSNDETTKSVFPPICNLGNFNSLVTSPLLGSSPNHNLSEVENSVDNDTSTHSCFERIAKDVCFKYHSNVFDFICLLEHSSRVKHLFMTLAENESRDFIANTKLLEKFHKFLASFSDCEVDLTDNDQKIVTNHIFSKSKVESSHLGLDNNKLLLWSCYLKSGENDQVFVILLPSTFQSFLYLLEMYDVDNGKFTKSDIKHESSFARVKKEDCASSAVSEEPQSPTTLLEDKSSIFSTKAHRRMSIKRLTSSNLSTSESPLQIDDNIIQRTFYLFVYNCSMKMLQSSFIHGANDYEKIKWPESLQDHRLHFDNDFDDYFHSFSQKPEYKNSKPPSPFQFSDDISNSAFPLKNVENDALTYVNDSIVWMYHKSFVFGIFYAIHADEQVFFSRDDLQVATDFLCRESVDEIDITDFMFLNSPQINEFKLSHLKPSMPSDIESKNIFSNSSSVDTEVEDFNAKPKPIPRKESNQKHVVDDQVQNTFVLQFDKDFASANGSVIGLSKKKNSVNSSESNNDVNCHVPNSKFSTNHASNISFCEQSAFTSVHRERYPETIKLTDYSTSDDELCALSSQKPAYNSERKSTTVPIKKIIKSEHRYSGLQTGWSHLPDFPLSLLDVNHSRHLSGSSDQIEKHFLQLLKSYCCAVPGVPFLFYGISSRLSSPKKTCIENVNFQLENDVDIEFINEKTTPPCDSANELNVPVLSTEASTYLADDDCYSDTSDEENVVPLFLNMMCTVHDLQTGNSGSLPVKCLPLSLKEILDTFDKPCYSINLSKIKITLDLIWIYLPSTSDEANVATVPRECSSFVRDVKNKVEWLLEDEIISSLRMTEPINTITLDRVAKHVQSLPKSSNTKAIPVPLELIFGVDRSNSLLRSEFEKYKISNYKLRKVEHYYFLSLERTFIPIPDSFNLSKKQISCSSVDNASEAFMSENKSLIAGAKDDSQSLVLSKHKDQAKLCQSSLISLHGDGNESNDIEKFSKNFKKALSSTELVSNNSSKVRRCTSASIVTSNSPSGKDAKPAPLSKSKVEISNITSPLPSVFHQNLQMSLSLDKEPKVFSSGSNVRGPVSSMPVTPSGVTSNTNMFVFPLTKSDTKLGGFASCICVTPTSEVSTRQYSQTSWLGSGYEGEESESGDESYYRDSFNEACTQQLPNFWLLVNFDNEKANIYYHRRSSTKVLSAVKSEHSRVFEVVSANLLKSCRAVNQILLLKMLYDNKWCHPLLVEEAPEDIWTKDGFSTMSQTLENNDDHTFDDSYRKSANDYLAASMDFPAGHFECKCILKETIILHHRIAVSKASKGGTVPSALSTVRSFMKNFKVSNHKNMFVFQVQDGTVYYCKLIEESKQSDLGGRRSSTFVESDQTNSARDAANSKLLLMWHGVHDLLPQHYNDLLELKIGIEKKLDDTVLEYITLMLCRNSQFKLTPADVCLIQPRQKDSVNCPVKPCVTNAITLPSQLCSSMTALLYYIHQHLLQFLAIPRYTDASSGQFLPILSDKNRSNTFTGPAMYLYTDLTEKGKKGHGIACVCLDYIEKNLSIFPSAINFDEFLKMDNLQEFTKMSACDFEYCSESNSSILIHIWTRGSLNVNILHRKMKTAVQNALYDAVTERCLEFPFVFQQVTKTKAMKPLFTEIKKDETNVSFSLSYLQTKLGVGSRLNEPTKKQVTQKDNISSGAWLNSFYEKIFPVWIEHMVNQSSPSVVKKTIDCPGKLNIEQVVSNINKIVSLAFEDSDVLKFYRRFNSNEKWSYTDQNEPEVLVPGSYLEYILLTRNFDLWKKATKASSCPLISNTRSFVTASLQKFPSHDVTVKPETSPCPQHDMMMSSSFIPRQHIACVIVSNGQINLFAYNITQDKMSDLILQLEECAKFHHARLKMLQSLTFQKLGLYKHFLAKQTSSKDPHVFQYSVEFLTRHTKVLGREKKRQRFTLVDKRFDDFLLNVPQITDVEVPAPQIFDQAALYGQQCFARLKQKLSLKEDHACLKDLWRRASGSCFSIRSETLKTVLSYARLMYSVTSPIVLDKSNRKNYVSLFEMTRHLKNKKGDSKQSTVLLRTSSFIGGYRRRSGDYLSKLSEKDMASSLIQDEIANFYQISCDFIAQKFVEIYSDHWKSLLELHVSDVVEESEDLRNRITHYRYRSSRGGIILIAFSVQPSYFQVKLYSISASLFFDQAHRSRVKSHSNFTSECEKIKRNLNLHQVALDVHIEYLHWYLKTGYLLTTFKFNFYDLLQSIITCYSSLLNNIQSRIYQDSHSVACSQVNSQDLYTFLVQNASAFDLQACTVLKDCSDMNENILFSDLPATQHINKCSSTAHGKWKAFRVIFKADDADTAVLRYHYYLLFYLDRTRNNQSLDASMELPENFLPEAKANRRRLSEAASRIGAGLQRANSGSVESTSFDVAAESYVACEKSNVETNLREYSWTATTECYRSRHLWKKLLCMCQDKSSGKGLTYSEFCTLRNMMQETAAAEYDERISKVFRKRNVAKQDQFIQKRLLKKFSKLSAMIVSPDNTAQHLCILPSRDVHVMVIVSTKSNSSEFDVAVLEPLPEHFVFHKDNLKDAWKDLLSKVCAALCTSVWMSWF